MRKNIICLVFMILFVLLANPSFAAVAKKKAPVKKKVSASSVVLRPGPTQEVKAVKQDRFLVAGGFEGGAAAIELGFIPPFAPRFNINAGYGAGKSYNVLIFKAGAMIPLRPSFSLAVSIDYPNYSSRVKSIPGMAEYTEKGGKFGLGVALVRELGRWSAKLGYSSALGLTFGGEIRI